MSLKLCPSKCWLLDEMLLAIYLCTKIKNRKTDTECSRIGYLWNSVDAWISWLSKLVGKELLCLYKVILHLSVRFCFVHLLHAYKCGWIKLMCVQCTWYMKWMQNGDWHVFRNMFYLPDQLVDLEDVCCGMLAQKVIWNVFGSCIVHSCWVTKQLVRFYKNVSHRKWHSVDPFKISNVFLLFF